MQICTVRCLRADHNQQTARRQISSHRRPRPLQTGSSTCPDGWKRQYRSVRIAASPLISAKTGLVQPTILPVYVPTTAQTATHLVNCRSFASASIAQTPARTKRSMRTTPVPRKQTRSRPHIVRSLCQPMFQQQPKGIHQGLRYLTPPSASLSRRHRAHQSLRLFPNPACRSLLRSRAQAFIHLQRQRQLPPPRQLKTRLRSLLLRRLEYR